MTRIPNIVPPLAPPARHVERGDYGYEVLACGRDCRLSYTGWVMGD